MHKLFKELRRREVFRTAGLYVGIAWIAVEVSSVLFDAFDAPEWALQAVILLAVIGLPVTIVLAWVFDITEKGIEVQADATDTTVIPFGGRRMDFVVIGVLSVALIFSVYLNIANKVETVDAPLEPLSILIADFENQTGDPLFDGSLEQAVMIGIEGASFVAAFERGRAQKIAAELQGADRLNAEVAQLVATREGIELVLSGSIAAKGERFILTVSALQPRTGEIIADSQVTAPSKLDVLAAVGELTYDLREALGEKAVDQSDLEITETFTAMSLEAVREYDRAQTLQYLGNFEQAIEHYRSAVSHDPKFGRAYSGWAAAARQLGLLDEARTAWENAMANLGSMTERERLRTQGIYYWGVTRNFDKAIETYETLVEKYPADFVGHNNLAVVKFFALDFEGARAAGEEAVGIYPGNAVARSNYATYAMFAGDFETAVEQAKQAQDEDPSWFAAWLPVAMNALDSGDIDAARKAYGNMAKAGTYGASTAKLGLADAELFFGYGDAARDVLPEAIDTDLQAGNNYGAAVKQMVLAETHLERGDKAAARQAAAEGVQLVSSDATLVPAALIYLSSGDKEEALHTASVLAEKLSPQSRAYADLIKSLTLAGSGDYVAAIEKLTAALDRADLWLIRFYLGRAYFDGGFYVEALDEFTAASERRGEATALFLDDLPTYHYAATVHYWLGRAQAELGMTDAAVQNFQAFIAQRSDKDPLAADARERIH
jgi:tetratricopeptide (TPR) repeat protein